MSIAPPSDIILDVAQAADPQRLQAATSKLARMASGSAAVPDDFATLLTQAGGDIPASPRAPTLRNSTLATTTATVVNQPETPYRKFEALLLQTFVQEILPKDDQLFGDAASADISRSMMAEQLAKQLAKSDRIGIARMIEKAHGPLHTASPPVALAAGPGQDPVVPAAPLPKVDCRSPAPIQAGAAH